MIFFRFFVWICLSCVGLHTYFWPLPVPSRHKPAHLFVLLLINTINGSWSAWCSVSKSPVSCVWQKDLTTLWTQADIQFSLEDFEVMRLASDKVSGVLFRLGYIYIWRDKNTRPWVLEAPCVFELLFNIDHMKRTTLFHPTRLSLAWNLPPIPIAYSSASFPVYKLPAGLQTSLHPSLLVTSLHSSLTANVFCSWVANYFNSCAAAILSVRIAAVLSFGATATSHCCVLGVTHYKSNAITVMYFFLL